VFERIFELVIPERHTEWSNEPDSLYNRVWDSTPVESAQQLSNLLTSGLTPVWTPWFQLVPGPLVEGEERSELRKSLRFVNQVLFLHLNLSNFTQQIQSMYLDTIVGTGAITIQPHRRGKGVEFSNVPIEQLSILRDSTDEITHVFRRHCYTAAEFLNMPKYVDKISDNLRDELHKNITRKVEILESVVEGDKPDKWHYYVILMKQDELRQDEPVMLEEKTFKRNPFKIVRWSPVPGQPFGRGPAMLSFGDIRLLNKIKELSIKNMAKAVAGIYTVRDDGVVNPRNIVLKGGALIPVGSNDGANPTIRELPRSGQFELTQFGLGDLRESIRKAFLADQFSPTVGTKMTATEIVERGRIISQNLGSTYASFQLDVFIPLLNDMIMILQEQGELPEGFKIDQEEVDVMFISSIANAQRLSEVDAMIQFAGITQQLAQLDPRAGILLNAQEFQRRIAELLAVDENLLRSDEEVEETTEQGVEAMAAMQGGGGDVPQGLPTG
jgi:hypothetical protein